MTRGDEARNLKTTIAWKRLEERVVRLQLSRTAASRPQIARFATSLAGAIALLCFYQPWVSASLPAAGESTLTGMDLANGAAARRVNAAIFSSRGGTGATPVPGAAVVGAGGLTLPARLPTLVPGGVAPPSGSGAGTSSDLVLPTRIPTVSAGGSAGATIGGPTTVPPGVAIATAAAATAQASSGRASTAAVVTEVQPDHLPQTLLYFVPLAAVGLAVFAAIWDRLREQRDRVFGKWWTIVLSAGGTLSVGYVLYKAMTATGSNDLLAPGTVKGPQWGLWGAFFAFLLSSLILAAAWMAQPTRSVEAQ